MPVKCDGVRPICGRCKGYDHTCSWTEEKKLRTKFTDKSSPNGIASDGQLLPASPSLRLAIQSYDKLIRSVRVDLPDSARAAVDVTLLHIQRRLPSDLVSLNTPCSATEGPAFPGRQSVDNANTQRYLGEASDVRFFHTVKSIFREGDQLDGTDQRDIQSYDQGVLHLEARDGPERQSDLPTRELADTYIEIYFFTIHIAYPFVSKPSFMARYEKFWEGDVETVQSSSWLPLLCKPHTLRDMARDSPIQTPFSQLVHTIPPSLDAKMPTVKRISITFNKVYPFHIP